MLIETERLLLRPMQVGDVAALVRLWSDPEVTRYLGGPRDPAYLEQVFGEELSGPSASPYDLWPVIEKASSRLVGHCGLLEKDVEGKAEIELVYVFAQAAWGRGYATEIARALKRHAREVLGLRRLVALVDPQNEASERVAIRVGMHLEKEVARPGGVWKRLYVVSLDSEANVG